MSVHRLCVPLFLLLFALGACTRNPAPANLTPAQQPTATERVVYVVVTATGEALSAITSAPASTPAGTPIPPEVTSGPIQPTLAPAPTTVSAPATATPPPIQPRPAAPTAVHVPPTMPPIKPTLHIDQGPNAPPGVYVTALRADPSQPVRGQGVRFLATFLNTTSEPQTYDWLVLIYDDPAARNSFGETGTVHVVIPPGESQQATGNDWHTGKGPCQDFVGRPYFVNTDKIKEVFYSTNTGIVTAPFQMCPP